MYVLDIWVCMYVRRYIRRPEVHRKACRMSDRAQGDCEDESEQQSADDGIRAYTKRLLSFTSISLIVHYMAVIVNMWHDIVKVWYR